MLILAAIATIALAWDLVQAGYIAQQRRTPRPLGILAGLLVLLAAPAFLIAVATTSAITGYSVAGVAWIWPVTVAMFVIESVYVTLRRMVTPFVGVPVAIYNALLLTVAVTRYIQESGASPPDWALALSAAAVGATGAIAGPVVLGSRWTTLVPLFAPAFPARHESGRVARVLVACFAAASAMALVGWWPAGARAVRSYDRYAGMALQERPAGDFAIGLRILPPLDAMPPTPALHSDLALVDTVGAEVVGLVLHADGAHNALLDSLARALDPLRRDSTSVVVTVNTPRRAGANRPMPGLDARWLSALARIGLSREARPATSVKWRVKRGLARIVQNNRSWPWKVRRLVHEALV